LGRLAGEHLSEALGEAAEAADEATPVERYLKSSKPETYPTLETMTVPGAHTALTLAGAATGLLSQGGMAQGPTLEPLATAAEGAALAMLALRAGLANEAWSGHTPTLPIAAQNPPPTVPAPAVGSDKKGKASAKEGGGRGGQKQAG
ncbi:unnamed protein product, partial [Discosporangium mesarthrocarpum]